MAIRRANAINVENGMINSPNFQVIPMKHEAVDSRVI
jgi:hypothetical protein